MRVEDVERVRRDGQEAVAIDPDCELAAIVAQHADLADGRLDDVIVRATTPPLAENYLAWLPAAAAYRIIGRPADALEKLLPLVEQNPSNLYALRFLRDTLDLGLWSELRSPVPEFLSLPRMMMRPSLSGSSIFSGVCGRLRLVS
jgi:hypothetical protein